MSAPTFSTEILFAALAAVGGSIAYRFMRILVPADMAWQAVTALLVLAYIAGLLLRSPRRTGRIAVLIGLLATDSAFMLFWPGDFFFLAAQGSLIWLSRSVFYHAGLLAITADLGLNLLAAAAAAWAVRESGSALLSIWSFFLVQAFFIRLPNSLTGNAKSELHRDRFAAAQREAEAALNRLAKSV